MKYYVLRIYSEDDDRDGQGVEKENGSYKQDGCADCIAWEEIANPMGGYEFSEDYVIRGMKRGSVTNLFHEHCRCRLLPSPDGTPIVTEYDRLSLLRGFLLHNATHDMSMEEIMEIQGRYG